MSDNLSDEQAINKAVDMLKERGIFDQIRKNCLEDINTKSSYLNLNQRCEGYVNKFLLDQEWDTTLNKNQLREKLRKSILESGIIKMNVTHLVEQVINPISFESKIEEQIRELLGIEEDDLFQREDTNKSNISNNDKLSDKLDDISDDDLSDDDLTVRSSFDKASSNEEIRFKSERDKIDNDDPIGQIDSKLNQIRLFRDQNNYNPIKQEKLTEDMSITSSISSTDDLDCMD